MPDVAMPRLSDSMEEGTILKWLKSDGDEVQRGDELVEIETDKANMTYEADQAGVLSIVAKEGDTLPVGETIARIGEAAEEAPSGGGEAEEPGEAEQPAGEEEGGGEEEQPQAAEPAQETATEEAEEPEEAATANGKPAERPEPAPAPSGESREGNGDGRVKASPVARRMARELGLELAALEGTGPGGRIVKADVEAAASGDGQAAEADVEAPAEAEAAPAEAAPAEEAPAEEAPAPAAEKAEVPPPVVADEGQTGRGEVTHEDLSRLQQTVARRMAESKATAPEFVLNAEVDMEEAVELRKQLKAAAGDAPAPVLQRLRGQGRRARAARVPARERRLPRREVRAVLARQRRRRGGRPGRARSSPRSSTPTASRSVRSRARAARSPSARGPGRSHRPSCRRGRSRSRTSGCSGSRASPRSSTRRRPRSSRSARSTRSRSCATARSWSATSWRSR